MKLEFSDACSCMNAILRLDLLVLQWPDCITLCVKECIGKNPSPTSARDKTKIKYISFFILVYNLISTISNMVCGCK